MSKKFVKGFPKIGFAAIAAAAVVALPAARFAPGHEAAPQAARDVNVKATLAAWTQPASSGWEYTVQRGDTLAVIAGREYGNDRCWPGIYSANEGSIRDPNLIYVGQRIRIPSGCETRQPDLTVTVSVTQPAPRQSYSGAPGSFQACVIQRESGGDPSAVNPYSGAGGLYGFLPSTWASLGFGGLPEDASVSTQNAAFEEEYALDGTSPWAPYDGC